MAESIIKHKGMGSWQSITLPYTAQTDGEFYLQINPNNSNVAYAYCTVGGKRLSALSYAGVRGTNTILVKKGDVISLESDSNVKDRTYAFRPIYY